MSNRRTRRVGTAAALVVYLLATRAAAEPAPSRHLRMRDPSSLTLKSGRTLDLPPGRFVEETLFEQHEAELKRVQELATRLTHENQSFRASAKQWKPGWVVLAITLATGIGAGIALAK